MLFSEANNHRVMSTDSASTVGTLTGFVVDPVTARVVAVRLKKSAGSGDTLHWEDMTAFGVDTITVGSADAIVDARGRAAEFNSKQAEMIGKRLLTDAGADIGTVTDVEFNPADGAVVSLITPSGPVHGGRLIGCGSYAVVVKDA